MTASSGTNGLEPQLGGSRRVGEITSREPQLGGWRQFDPATWILLTDASRLAKQDLIANLHPTACESYARKLIYVLRENPPIQQSFAPRMGWSAHSSIDLRAGAAYSLGLLGQRISDALRNHVVDTLLYSFDAEDEPTVQIELVRALGKLGGEEVEGRLLKALDNADSGLRQQIILSLGWVGSDATLDCIWQLQAGIASQEDAASAIEALGMLGARQASDERDEIFRYLTGTFMRGRIGLRCAAARALGHLRDERAHDVLVKTALQGQGAVQSAAIQGLGLLGDEHAVPPLIGVLVTSTEDIIRDVVDTLVQIGTPSLSPVLAVSAHPENHVRQAAVEVLGRLGDSQSLGVLREALADSQAEVRREAVCALGQFAASHVLEPLLAMMEDSDAEVRKVTAAVLGNLGDHQAVGALCLALWDVDMTVRWYAAYALGVLGDTRAVDPLCQALGDRSDHVASTAANSLVMIGTAAIDPLEACLNSPKKRMREYAAGALQRIGTQDARAALIRQGKD